MSCARRARRQDEQCQGLNRGASRVAPVRVHVRQRHLSRDIHPVSPFSLARWFFLQACNGACRGRTGVEDHHALRLGEVALADLLWTNSDSACPHFGSADSVAASFMASCKIQRHHDWLVSNQTRTLASVSSCHDRDRFYLGRFSLRWWSIGEPYCDRRPSRRTRRTQQAS